VLATRKQLPNYAGNTPPIVSASCIALVRMDLRPSLGLG